MCPEKSSVKAFEKCSYVATASLGIYVNTHLSKLIPDIKSLPRESERDELIVSVEFQVKGVCPCDRSVVISWQGHGKYRAFNHRRVQRYRWRLSI